MFTGIVEETGAVRSLRPRLEGITLRIAAEKVSTGLTAGDSVAVNGVCLTVTECETGLFSCDLSAETVRRTTLGQAREGWPVNLERPVAVGDRLGGHLVQGHVDGVGSLLSSSPSGDGCVMAFGFPRELERYLVYKGSIAVDGISLTIASIEEDSFTIAVIPHTLHVTNLQFLKAGDPVNLEVDILGKYFERFFQLGLIQDKIPKLTFEYLKEQGF